MLKHNLYSEWAKCMDWADGLDDREQLPVDRWLARYLHQLECEGAK